MQKPVGQLAAEAAEKTSLELHVLARMYWSNDDAQYFADHVDPAHFVAKDRRDLFVELAHAAAKGFTPVTFRAHIQTVKPTLEPLVDEIMGSIGTAAVVDAAANPLLAEMLRVWSQAEKFRRAIDYASKRLQEGTAPDEVRLAHDRHLLAIDTAAITERRYDDMRDMAARVREHLTSGVPRGLGFGYRRLDRKVVPLLPGNFMLVGGTSGSGKSTVLRNFIRNWNYWGERVVLFSIEMMGDEQLPNFGSMDTGVDIRRYYENSLTDQERTDFLAAVDKIVTDERMTLNERSAQTPESILRAMKRYRATGHSVFVIDHLHRVTYSDNPRDDIRLPIANFARSLKSFAVDNGCIVVAGVQYAKNSKHDEPDDSWIRESNNILEEADRVLHVWRPLVVGEVDPLGVFQPQVGTMGERTFAKFAKKNDVTGEDSTRVYIKIGKQRIRPVGGIVSIPFNHFSGLMYEQEDERAYGSAA